MTIRSTSIDAGNAPLQENLGNSTIAVPLVLLEGVSVVLRMMERMLVNPRFCQEMVEADLAPDVQRAREHLEKLTAPRSEVYAERARKAAAARWAGHIAKRPSRPSNAVSVACSIKGRKGAAKRWPEGYIRKWPQRRKAERGGGAN